jgi:hypothetical protein
MLHNSQHNFHTSHLHGKRVDLVHRNGLFSVLTQTDFQVKVTIQFYGAKSSRVFVFWINFTHQLASLGQGWVHEKCLNSHLRWVSWNLLWVFYASSNQHVWHKSRKSLCEDLKMSNHKVTSNAMDYRSKNLPPPVTNFEAKQQNENVFYVKIDNVFEKIS